MKILLSTFGAAGAAMVLVFGFMSADAEDGVFAAPEPRDANGYVISGHGGGFGSCGMKNDDDASRGDDAQGC